MDDEYYHCPVCFAIFDTQWGVDDHMRHIHTDSSETSDVDGDSVNHPSHYTAYKGVEIIDLTEQMNFCRGNAVKYIARAGLKDPNKEIEDLEKARWYINREIERLEANAGAPKEGTS